MPKKKLSNAELKREINKPGRVEMGVGPPIGRLTGVARVAGKRLAEVVGKRYAGGRTVPKQIEQLQRQQIIRKGTSVGRVGNRAGAPDPPPLRPVTPHPRGKKRP